MYLLTVLSWLWCVNKLLWLFPILRSLEPCRGFDHNEFGNFADLGGQLALVP